ncbi:diaminobutyrate acetyltransferase [Magnetovibrio sp.]|uniref:diaminobutyrate acetyltransferase n=1 Tax=Magnetovibrio sp. TaxID=2024836 RepID=UPI002F92BC42
MPDLIASNESIDPSTTSGNAAPAPSRVEGIAAEAILDTDGVGIRAPSHNEGALMWELARDAGGLDLNSPYAYMMACRHFPNSCAIAEIYGQPAGFVMAHRIPARNDVLFIWQVAVLPEFRGLGIAKRMFDSIVERDVNAGVRTIEATVTPSNTSSAALFSAFAKGRDAHLDIRSCFGADDFPEGQGHEAEDLYVISPITSIA